MAKRLLVLLLGVLYAICAPAQVSEKADLREDIIGKWYAINSGEQREFLKDGTVIIVAGGDSIVGNYKFIDNSRLRVDLSAPFLGSSAMVFEVSISETGELSLKEPSGKVRKYLTEDAYKKQLEEQRKTSDQEKLKAAEETKKAELKKQEANVSAIIQRFRLNNDDTVHDLKTGLTWFRRPVIDCKWSEMVARCKKLSIGGRAGWHMATRSELETLIGEDGISIVDTPDGRFFGDVLSIGKGPIRVADSINEYFSLSWRPGKDYGSGWQSYGKWNTDASALCVKKE